MPNHRLVNKVVTTALTGDDIYVGPVYHLAQPILSALIQCAFTRGSGGTSVDVYVQTSLDGGVSWGDVANFNWATTTGVKVINLSSLTPVTTAFAPSDGSMSSNTNKDGFLGSLWRVKMKSSGEYGDNTTVIVDASFKTALVG